MTNYIEEMMMTAGVLKEDWFIDEYYPDFTPEKQMQIIRLIIHKIASFDSEHKDFPQALAQLTTELMNAGELDKKKVKEILEG